MRRRLEKLPEPAAEINVTPFVDVLLVLVVVLLIASPFLHRQVNVDLPKAKVNERNQRAKERLIISLDAAGFFYAGQEKLDEKSLLARTEKWLAAHPGQRVFIRADKSIRYELVVQLMAKLKESGAKRIGLLVGGND